MTKLYSHFSRGLFFLIILIVCVSLNLFHFSEILSSEASEIQNIPHALSASRNEAIWYELMAKVRKLSKQVFYSGVTEETTQLAEEALKVAESTFNQEHPYHALSLEVLATLYQSVHQFSKAERLYQQALPIFEKNLGPSNPRTLKILQGFAGLYFSEEEYPQAIELYERSLKINEEVFGAESLETAINAQFLAICYRNTGQSQKASDAQKRYEAFYKKYYAENRSEAQGVQSEYNDDPLAGLDLNFIKETQKEVEVRFQDELNSDEKKLGSEHPQVALALKNLAALYFFEEKDDLAESFYQKALTIEEKSLLRASPPNSFRQKRDIWTCGFFDITIMTSSLIKKILPALHPVVAQRQFGQ